MLNIAATMSRPWSLLQVTEVSPHWCGQQAAWSALDSGTFRHVAWGTRCQRMVPLQLCRLLAVAPGDTFALAEAAVGRVSLEGRFCPPGAIVRANSLSLTYLGKSPFWKVPVLTGSRACPPPASCCYGAHVGPNWSLASSEQLPRRAVRSHRQGQGEVGRGRPS